ncbi:helix-turn-helix domain-containing protein [Nocardia sp. CWNU-33]|uniref:helix-turn-helix domain-containing protein n=1 Tax=Nocardia sp. CWNU-33 TaxID=3392117 RepID=UPI00398F2530
MPDGSHEYTLTASRFHIDTNHKAAGLDGAFKTVGAQPYGVADPTHLIRAFSRQFGMPPHQYLISRRVDLARPLLLDGMPARDVAAATGFHDQPHLIRHFKRILGTTPGQYAHSADGPHARMNLPHQ